tara:strand:+ start:65 stop:553 length:489 start_codon:yes stop_codon:yes gene_type:complete
MTFCNIFHFIKFYYKINLFYRRIIKELKYMINKINKVKKFHELFFIGNEDEPKAVIDESTFLLRHRLMKEENEEYLEACKDGDMIEIADALGDMLYIWCGTVLKHGMQDIISEVFDEIQRSNMSKLGEDNKPIFRDDGKVMKGPNYFKPDIKGVFKKYARSI